MAMVVGEYTKGNIMTLTLRICSMSDFWRDVLDKRDSRLDVMQYIEGRVKKIYFDFVEEELELFSIDDIYEEYSTVHITYSLREIKLDKDMTLQKIVEYVMRNI